MSGILQRWIEKRTGLLLDLTQHVFCSQVSDGKVFAHLLYSYGVINKDHLDSIPSAENISETLINLSKVAEWLKPLEMDCDEDVLLEVASGKGSAAIRLLYQLYLALEEKSHGRTTPCAQMPSRNELDSEEEESEEHSPSYEDQDHPFSVPLLINKNVIQWHKDKYTALTEKCQAMKKSIMANLQERYETKAERHLKISDTKTVSYTEIPEDLNLRFCVESREFTYEELLQQQQDALTSSGEQPNYSIAMEITDNIRKKRRTAERENELKRHMHKMLLNETWEEIQKIEEEKLHNIIVKKLQKQSAFEKRMIEKLLEVQQHKHCILANKRLVQERLKKEREEEMWRLKNLPRETSFDRLILEHKRLYNERMKAKAEKHFNTCWGMIKDMADISLRNAEFAEMYGQEVPARLQRDWKNLFIAEKPIMDIVENVEDIVDLDAMPEGMEEIFTTEIYRQNTLDLKDFEAYLHFEIPWELLPYQSEKFDIARLGMNVLGFAVHRLLDMKYPKFVPPKVPGLPDFTTSVCIRGIADLTILPRLQKLLMKRKTKLVQMEEVLRFCEQALEDEMIYEYPDIPRKPTVEAKPAVVPKKGAKKEKPPSAKKSDKSKATSAAPTGDKKDKENQTPRMFPDEIPELTPQAQLALDLKHFRTRKKRKPTPSGSENSMHEEELLETAEEEKAEEEEELEIYLDIPPTDEMLIAMFIEYLKCQKDTLGWALINYPQTVEQTILLEEALGNKKIDPSGIDQSDPTAEKRNSKIVPNPKAFEEDPFFKTSLTAFITVMPEYDKHQEEIEEDDDLTILYTNQGCHYSLYFKSTDLPFVKHLAKLIIGDFSLPRKPSLELFGDTITYMEAYTNEEGSPAGKMVQKGGKPAKGEKGKKSESGEKGKSPRTSKQRVSGDSRKGSTAKSPRGSKQSKDRRSKGSLGKLASAGKGKTSKGSLQTVPFEMIDIAIQFPEVEEEEEEEPLPVPQPGEDGWAYIELPIPEEIELLLASVWENAETIYICDFCELFFLLRTLHSTIIPYTSYVRDHMDAFILRSDSIKQDRLNDFQHMYNSEAADLRNDVQFKAEYHTRIADLREQLREICDTMMKESEAERQRLIQDNWVAIQACEMTNNFINAFQIEMDLDTDTQAMMYDYYMGVIMKDLSELTIPPKVQLKKIDTPSFITASYNVCNVLTNLEADANNIPFDAYLQTACNSALQVVNKWHADAIVNHTKIYNLFNPTKATKMPKFFEPTEDVKEESERILAEFNCFVKGEHERVILRLELLKAEGLRSLKEFFVHTTDTFHKFFNEITNRYYSEISSVDNVCELLARAVEEEVRIQPQLTLQNARFFIQPNLLCFPDPPLPPEPPLEELERDGLFKIQQLEKLRRMLVDLAPSGKIAERVLTFLLQDMIVQNAEDGRDPMVPKLWMKLQPNQVGEVMQKLFGNWALIDWKEFLIFNLGLKYPNEEELMDVRKQFRDKDPNNTELIEEVEYPDIKFWFEDTSSDSAEYTTILIRQILFDLFKIDDFRLNYTALLLAFCKDASPPRGVAKAIQLSLGKFVCYNPFDGEAFIRSVRIQRVLDEINRLDAVSAAESAILKAADRGIHACSSVIIEEILEEILDEAVGPDEAGEEQEEEEVEEMVSVKELTSSQGSRLSLLMEDRFSNIAIGYEARDCPPLVYFLPLEVIQTIMSIQGDCSDELEALHKAMKLAEFSDSVLTHEFLNCEQFQQILYRSSRFMAINPLTIVASLVLNNENQL